MFKKIIFSTIIFIIIITSAMTLYSCAKKEPAQNPASDILANKISEQFQDLDKELEKEESRELFDKNNDVDFSKVENYSVRKSKNGENREVGIFKLYDDASVDYIKNVAAKRVLNLQESGKNIANNAEVRSYGNYVYYVSHEQKDKIFKIIEDELKGNKQNKKV